MNQLARRLGDTRSNAQAQIKALGWPVDIYHDVAWYPDLPALDGKVLRSSKNPKKAARAERMRDSIFEIDVALAALNHFAETTVFDPKHGDPDAIIEALEASINAIEALLAPDADVGRRQREHGIGGGWTEVRRRAHEATLRGWAKEDNRLRAEKPHLNISARARHIADDHNRRPENRHKPVSWETVRSALRRLKT